MKWFLTGSLLIMLAACQQRPASLEVLADPLIVGQPPAVLLDLERTIIPLGEYVPDPIRIDSVTVDGLFNYDIDNSNVLLIGRPQKPLYALTLWDEGIGESMLLKKSKKTLHSFFYQGKANAVKVKGDFNDWDESKTIMKRNGQVHTTYLLLSPGRYEYQLIVDGKELIDPHNRISVQNDRGSRNSVLNISGVDSAKMPLLEIAAVEKNQVSLTVDRPIEGVYAFWNNTMIPQENIRVEEGNIDFELPGNAIEEENSMLRVWAEDKELASKEVTILLQYGEMVSSKMDVN